MRVIEGCVFDETITVGDLGGGDLFKVISTGEVYVKCGPHNELPTDKATAVTLVRGTIVFFPYSKVVIPCFGQATIRKK